MLPTGNQDVENNAPDRMALDRKACREEGYANRRQILGVTAVAAGGVAAASWGGLTNSPLAAQMSGAGGAVSAGGGDFLALSQALVERNDLSPALARRVEAALIQANMISAANLSKLVALARQGGGASDIQARAQAAGLGDVVTAIVGAWYMGSVDNGMNAPTFAYYDALMWKTVADGLPVQTYCWGKPGWWTQPPPAAGVPLTPPNLPSSSASSSGGKPHGQ